MAHWYGAPSRLLMVDRGRIVENIWSTQGVRQGDALSSLLFALSMTEIFKTAAETSGCRMIAVQDDVYFLGTPACAATAWDALKTLTTHNTGLELNGEKTSILLPDESSTRLFLERKLTPSTTFIPALGSIVTREMSVLSRWLVEEMRRSHGKLFRTITDKRMPSQTGFLLLRMCAVPPGAILDSYITTHCLG